MNNFGIAILLLCCVMVTLARPGQSSGCSAVGGPGKGLPCIFPFKYNDVVYNTCSNANKHVTNNEPWCSTRIDETGTHIGGRGNWGNCDETCPLLLNDIESSGDSCECVPPWQCKWSMDAMSRALMLPRNHPKIKIQTGKIQKNICDIKNRLVYCCGSGQQPPAYADIKSQSGYEDTGYYDDEAISCSTVKRDGYSCVPSNQCEDLLDIRGAEVLACDDSSQKCCHKSQQRTPDQTPIEYEDYYDEEAVLCSTVARDGYSCVPSNQCEDLLDVRGAGEPVCEDTSQKCCHKSKQLPPDNTRKVEYDDYYDDEVVLCSTVARDGYSCVPSNQCEDLLDVRGAGEPVCEDSSQKCCHKSKQVQENESETKLCSAFFREGYKCVPHDDCNSLLGKRTDGFDYYYDSDVAPVCDDSSQTCCHEDQLTKKAKRGQIRS